MRPCKGVCRLRPEGPILRGVPMTRGPFEGDFGNDANFMQTPALFLSESGSWIIVCDRFHSVKRRRLAGVIPCVPLAAPRETVPQAYGDTVRLSNARGCRRSALPRDALTGARALCRSTFFGSSGSRCPLRIAGASFVALGRSTSPFSFSCSPRALVQWGGGSMLRSPGWVGERFLALWADVSCERKQRVAHSRSAERSRMRGPSGDARLMPRLCDANEDAMGRIRRRAACHPHAAGPALCVCVSPQERMTERLGTVRYVAPEVPGRSLPARGVGVSPHALP